MSMFTVDLTKIANFQKYISASPAAASKALTQTLNGGIKYAYAEASRQIRSEVNISQDYIGSVANGNHMKISQYATDGSPIAVISASRRGISLARFVTNRNITNFGKQQGTSVEVKPGQIKQMPGTFLLKLRAGTGDDDSFNLGLAIRMKPGQKPPGKTGIPIPLGTSKRDRDVYLLYGPSVDQVFNQVRGDIEPKVTAWVTNEFLRQMGRVFGQ